MRSRLVLLTCQTLTLGLMMAFLMVPASSLFMNRYGATGLPYAYLAVAAAGVLVSTAIRRAQARLPVATVAGSVLTVHLILVAGGWLILTISDGWWVTFPLLVLFPLAIPIGFLIVGSQAGRLLDVRQLKAHFPRVVAGFSVGFGVGSLVSAWLVPLFGSPVQLLGFAAAATMVMIALVATTARRHDALRMRPAEPPLASSHTRSAAPRRADLLRHPLVLTIFGYQLLSSAVAQLVDYAVWDRAAARYPDPVALAQFFSLFGVVINVVTIVFVVVFAGRLLTRFGVGVGLTADPALILLCVVVATVTGFAGGITGVTFFVVVCAAQVGDIALSDGLRRTGINATYQALPAELRLRAQTMIEGAGVPLALGFVGVLLLAVHALSLDVLAVSVVTVVLSLLWLVMARKTFQHYGTGLRAEVTSRPWDDPAPLPVADPAARAAVATLLESPDTVDREVGLRALVESGDPSLQGRVRALLDDPNPAWQALGLHFAAPGGMVPAVMGRAFDGDWATELRVVAIHAGVGLDDEVFREDLADLLDDPDPVVRVAAAAGQVDFDGETGNRALAIWRGGLHDQRLVGEALTGAAASPSVRFVPDLLGLAASDTPPVALTEALSAHADLLVPALHDLVKDGPAERKLVERLMRAVADGRTPSSLEILRWCLTSPRREVGEMAARALAAADRTVEPGFLGCAIEPVARRVAMALDALTVLDERPALQPLRNALHDEIICAGTHVTTLVVVAYGRRTGRAVAALRSDSSADRGLALEMLEVTMGTDAARAAIALVDPTLDSLARRNRLAGFAPHGHADPSQWLREFVVDNEKHWQESWLRVCALYAAPAILGGSTVEFAQQWVGDGDPIVAETAAWAVRVGAPGFAGDSTADVRIQHEGVGMTIDSRLQDARGAVRRRSWGEAYALLTAADGDGALGPDSLESLGVAAWAEGRFTEAERARERSYAGYSELGDRPAAARVALALASDHFPRGHIPVARGWLAAAERLLVDQAECAEHGRFEWLRSQLLLLFDGDVDGSMTLSEQATGIGRRLGDIDVEMLGLSTTARALARIGRVEEATALLDAGMAAATSGQLGPHTAQIVYCHTLCSCSEIQDYDRARSWSEVAESCCARDGIVPVSGDCRVHRAGLHLLSGEWAVAEQEATRGSEELGGEMVHRGFALYELGELHLRRGNLDAAEKAFRAAEEAATPAQPGLALTKLAAGNTAAAASMIFDALQDARAPLSRALLLPARVEIAIAVGDLDGARAAADEFGKISSAFRTAALEAAALTANGMVALAEGNVDHASSVLRHAVRRWQKVGAPYEAARARVRLADALLARSDRGSAAAELEAARDVFERLGAAVQAATVTAMLQRMSAGENPTSERVTQTFVFTDIVGSTGMIAAIGDDAWVHLRRWHDQALRTIFATHGGQEIDHAGDGFFVAFPTQAVAIECAIEIQRSLEAHRRLNGFAPQVRIGIHAAAAMVAGGDYQGAGVHVAARIGAAAVGGEILASLETAHAAGFATGETRRLSLKGVLEPVDATSIAWREV